VARQIVSLANLRFEESVKILEVARQTLLPRVEAAATVIIESYREGGGVFTFGNGGSAADAQHIAAELTGRFLKNRRPLKAEAFSTNTSSLTALGNDFGYETVFERLIEANTRKGDVAIGLSTSGNSPNVVLALKKAREMGVRTIAFTGQGGGKCAPLADVLLEAPSTVTPRIQECHVVLYHILCELVENAFAK
jgi:D-sedoheptulose 7-phosphate isomerase